jgi:hypothetical protein
MGTTLTGTTPQDTYDSLIKVTDNGPISGTAKFLSDGLGNDSILALSNARVGVGTASPSFPLHVLGSAGTIARITDGTSHIDLYSGSGLSEISAATTMLLSTSGTEKVRITSAGNVGIGTTTVSAKLTVKGTVGLRNDEVAAGYATLDIVPATAIGASANRIVALNTTDIAFETSGAERFRITNNGVTFNGDTAAANALDDYEEGTWTPVVFGGTSGTATYTARAGYYTKIGRQVVITWFITFEKATIVGNVGLAGLPFVVSNLGNQFPQAAILIDNLATAYVNPLLQLNNNTSEGLIIVNNGSITDHNAMQGTQLGAGTMAFRGTATYFV